MNEINQKNVRAGTKDLVRKDHCGFDCCSASCMVTFYGSVHRIKRKRTFRRRKDHQRNFPPGYDLLFDLSTSGVAYLLLETMCIAFLGTIVGCSIIYSAFFPCGSKSDAKAGCTDLPCIYYGDPYDSGICIRTYVYPCDRTWTICWTLTMSLCSIGMISKMFIREH